MFKYKIQNYLDDNNHNYKNICVCIWTKIGQEDKNEKHFNS